MHELQEYLGEKLNFRGDQLRRLLSEILLAISDQRVPHFRAPWTNPSSDFQACIIAYSNPLNLFCMVLN